MRKFIFGDNKQTPLIFSNTKQTPFIFSNTKQTIPFILNNRTNNKSNINQIKNTTISVPNIIQHPIQQSKICIIYVYYERKNEKKNKTNLSYFIKYGLDDTKWIKMDITTIFVINGHQCEVIIPKKENIHILREDNCSDYEGWFNGINYMSTKYNKPLEQQFDYLCLINSSTFGPFMESTVDSHWLCPFYDSMVKNNANACSPYINMFRRGNDEIDLQALSCSFTLIKINSDIIKLLTKTPVISTDRANSIYRRYTNTVLGKKENKLDSILTGEFGLSRVLQNNGYNICCLYKNNHRPSEPLYEREEFFHKNNDEFLKQTIFIKNIWRVGEQQYPSIPVLYDYCINFINKQLKYKNIFDGLDVEYNYDLLNVSLNNKKDFFHKYGYAEEYILFPKKKYDMKGVVLYAHYDSNNIIADYVIQGLKSLVYIGYDVLFYTASSSINNIDVSILPFEIHYVKNKGAGTDWEMWLNGLKLIKETKLNYEWIMFINDSLLFPINGITNFMNSVINSRDGCDFWGHWYAPEKCLVGTPVEFKFNLIDDVIIFIEKNVYIVLNNLLNKSRSAIHLLEIPFTQYLLNKNYLMKSIIDYRNLKGHNVVCPSFHPQLLNQWINNPYSFAIKWKYCISYLKNDIVSEEFNFLTRYLYYGPYGTISNGEKDMVFPKSIYFV